MLVLLVLLDDRHSCYSFTRSHGSNNLPLSNPGIKPLHCVTVRHTIMAAQGVQTPIDNTHPMSTAADTHGSNKCPPVFIRMVSLCKQFNRSFELKSDTCLFLQPFQVD